MPRNFGDWLTAYCDYASYTEAPRRMHFWCGVSAIAGALRRRVWIDQFYFKWHANFYVILVAPPGIVSKSSTINVAMQLLRKVPGIKFGPDVVTWQALVKAFSECKEEIKFTRPDGVDDYLPMCALTLESSEFGNLLNPQDRDMVDLLVTLWDGKQGAFTKVTKMSGSDIVENPWINLIAGTTPAWIAGNFPEYMIGGGFTSRCVFVYAEEKEKLVAYPSLVVPAGLEAAGDALVRDLEHIATQFLGAFTLSPDAVKWGQLWYERHYAQRPPGLDDERFGGYIARKQTHVHKLALVLSASEKDAQTITAENLALADRMVSDLEADMPRVFSKIGRTEESVQAERFVGYISRSGKVEYSQAYRFIHAHFPDIKDFEGIVAGALRAGLIKLEQVGSNHYLVASDLK